MQNLFQFANKQCSNPLDIVYSILSISTDGHRLQVKYGGSRAAFLRNVTCLNDGELCFWRLTRVLLVIPDLQGEKHTQSELFVRLDAYPINSQVDPPQICAVCHREPGLQTFRGNYRPRKTYLHCLGCRHGDGIVFAGHLLISVDRDEEDRVWNGSTSEWRMYYLPRWQSQTHAPLFCNLLSRSQVSSYAEWSLSVTIDLTLGCLYNLINRASRAGPTLVELSGSASSHEPGLGWQVVN
jgi:hypothetical protein